MRSLPFRNRKQTAEITPYICNYNRNGNELVIDCDGCEGQQDLGNERCLMAILNILSREAGVEEIILSGNWEISYRGDSIHALGSMAKIVRFCHDLSMLPNRFQDCSTCPLAPYKFYRSLARGLPTLPPRVNIERLAKVSSKHPHGCHECIERIQSNTDGMRYSLDELEKDVARMAYRVVDNEA